MRCTLTMGDGNFDSIRPHISITWVSRGLASYYHGVYSVEVLINYASICFQDWYGQEKNLKVLAIAIENREKPLPRKDLSLDLQILSHRRISAAKSVFLFL